MTHEQRAAIMQKVAEQFVNDADSQYQSMTNEQITVVMLGFVAGAISIMAASGLPWANIQGAINDIITDMSS